MLGVQMEVTSNNALALVQQQMIAAHPDEPYRLCEVCNLPCFCSDRRWKANGWQHYVCGKSLDKANRHVRADQEANEIRYNKRT